MHGNSIAGTADTSRGYREGIMGDKRVSTLEDIVGKPDGKQNQCFGHIGQGNCVCPYCKEIRRQEASNSVSEA